MQSAQGDSEQYDNSRAERLDGFVSWNWEDDAEDEVSKTKGRQGIIALNVTFLGFYN